MTTEDHHDGRHDFNPLHGSWTVQHRRLRERLAGCTEWEEFTGTTHMQPLLGGLGNVDDNVLELPGGTYRAATLRSFDAAQRLWSIWWLDARHPGRLDPPVVGRFEAGLGRFECDDVFKGRPIRVRFQWSAVGTDTPRWEQAFSEDGGRVWETNWEMSFRRI